MCADSIFIRESKNGPSIRGSSCSSPESGKTAPWCEATEAPGNSVPYRSSLTKYSNRGLPGHTYEMPGRFANAATGRLRQECRSHLCAQVRMRTHLSGRDLLRAPKRPCGHPVHPSLTSSSDWAARIVGLHR